MNAADAEDELRVLTVHGIRTAGRSLPPRFRLYLQFHTAEAVVPAAPDEAVSVRVAECLRLLPGRRLVARAEVSGRRCLLKLFLGRGARRYRDRELAGCRLLAEAGVATPEILGEVTDPKGQGLGILFDYLPAARAVGADDEAQMALAAAELARLHAFGAWHGDLHLNNFLFRGTVSGESPEDAAAESPDRRVYIIDGDGVRKRRSSGAAGPLPLDVAASLRNLATLCAQRPPLLDASLPGLLAAYARGRGWATSGGQFDTLLASLVEATRRQRRRRVRRYLRKAQRDCTEYVCERSFRRYFVCLRDCLTEELLAFRQDPESFFVGAEMLKDGNSATVVRSRIGQRSCVIKRYNIKSPWHALRRTLKPRSRFRRAWCNGQRLHFLRIPTARPLALLERRHGPLRGVAYLVMEDCGADDLSRLAAGTGLTGWHIDAVTRIFRALVAAGLSHGDTKATNFLVAGDDVLLVDLDAMRESPAGQSKDIGRFLANWDPALGRRFRERFAEAHLPLPD